MKKENIPKFAKKLKLVGRPVNERIKNERHAIGNKFLLLKRIRSVMYTSESPEYEPLLL